MVNKKIKNKNNVYREQQMTMPTTMKIEMTNDKQRKVE